jgi:acetoin utilization deacetylase AcuC-like enzyme
LQFAAWFLEFQAVIIFHDPHCAEYSKVGHPEHSQRITGTVPLLQARHPNWEWRVPQPANESALLPAHSHDHIERIESATRDFDADTPVYPQLYEHALRSVGAAVDVARAAMRGERTFSLMRPPGHHATPDQAMGFCYFGNIAIAAFDAIENGASRVAIWDFDAHHGNGTEAIVAGNPHIAFASIHQFPAYPGTGAKSFDNIDNYPIPPGTPRREHVEVAERALQKLLRFKPDLLLVSAGFDAYARDPLVQMALETEDFARFGQRLSQVGTPVGAILEGGYSDDLPELIDAFLTAWAG